MNFDKKDYSWTDINILFLSHYINREKIIKILANVMTMIAYRWYANPLYYRHVNTTESFVIFIFFSYGSEYSANAYENIYVGYRVLIFFSWWLQTRKTVFFWMDKKAHDVTCFINSITKKKINKKYKSCKRSNL